MFPLKSTVRQSARQLKHDFRLFDFQTFKKRLPRLLYASKPKLALGLSYRQFTLNILLNICGLSCQTFTF